MPPTRVPADAAEPVPVYDFPEDAARALAHHYAWLTRATGRVPELPDVRRDEAAGLLAAALAAGPDPRWLAPEEIGRLFDCYGLPLSTVERTVGGGVAELLVGVVHDPLFGPVLACLVGGPARRAALGRGGADHPLTDADAADMVRSLAAFPLQAGIIGEAAVDPVRKERVLRSFARAIHDLTDYIPGPDMGTDETCMAWIHDEIGRAVGLPAVLGGIPLDQIGATGFGLAVCADAVEAAGHLRISGARVAIQGFGAVGRHTARFLAQRGARIVGVSDRGGAVVDGHGSTSSGCSPSRPPAGRSARSPAPPGSPATT